MNPHIGIRYLLASAVLVTAGILLRPIGLPLMWPAVSLAIVAAGYFGAGAAIYHKSNGQLSLFTWLIFWPVLIGQHISLMHYRRQCRPWDVLTDRLWIGRKLSSSEAVEAVRAGVCAVLDLTGEFSESPAFRAVRYLQLPILDLTAPTAEQLNLAVEFIQTNAQSGVVYVHCKIGYSRTAAVAGAFLIATKRAASVDQAIAMLRSARPTIVIRPEAVRAIKAYFVSCFPGEKMNHGDHGEEINSQPRCKL